MRCTIGCINKGCSCNIFLIIIHKLWGGLWSSVGDVSVLAKFWSRW